MTAVELRVRMEELVAERFLALDRGLPCDSRYLHDLDADLAAAHAAYVGLAVTEIATLQAEIEGARVG